MHDCYWTHASDVTKMNQVCRENFVNLHSQPILDDLSRHFEESYISFDALPSDHVLAKAQILFRQVPEKGELDLEVVKDSIYFFS